MLNSMPEYVHGCARGNLELGVGELISRSLAIKMHIAAWSNFFQHALLLSAVSVNSH